ncbi:MAG TPA: VIT family protein [Casimicrobium sp.]|nr:VIT family protein [Casimicrobium sp.]
MRGHFERHRTQRVGWLRAAVLGANDGIVSTASLLVGVAAANATHSSIMLTGVAALVAGAMSMASGEYVSVHSQSDAESADLAREFAEIEKNPTAEHAELAAIYVERGLNAALAKQVSTALMNHDAIGSHAREELGITEVVKARPIQAALASAASFAVGALLPLAVAALAPANGLLIWLSATSLIFLALLGVIAAQVGGANIWISAWRVTFWGALALGITAGVGKFFGAVV